ncbi:hypothetical protein NE865_12817 [Phthorimaea operculella]|nr:hypothetical protein NE865_12817 [Phthorimaea operculella]
MAAPRAALCALFALTCARAEIYSGIAEPTKEFHSHRSIDSAGDVEVRGCWYAGRWFAAGASVRAADACLRCRCAHGALSCARAACAPTPDPPPRRCAVLHRRGACCPELHCPDGVKTLELEAAGRLVEDSWDIATPSAPSHACVEEGAVFAAGSALSARAACEHTTMQPIPTSTTATHRIHDCEVNGEWFAEGERVSAAAVGAGNCTQCFCLRGAVRCQPLSCAPALRGCKPLLRSGHCCPHQYQCPQHKTNNHIGALAPLLLAISDNSLVSHKNDERSFRISATPKAVFMARTASSNIITTKSASGPPPATTKVKRKTNDQPPSTTSHKTTQKEIQATSPKESKTNTSPASPKDNTSSITTKSNQEPVTTTAKLVTSTETTTTPRTVEQTTTEQPEGSVKIIINGTINCTAELSSTLSNATVTNQTDKITDTEPRTPQKGDVEAQTTTLQPVDIITDRNTGGGYAEGDTFVINVTSSLNGNSSRQPAPPPDLTDITRIVNMTKKTKEDYDYDYTEPTLPPSLPNLKIIPFVAADAVVDEDDVPAKEETLTYPLLEREDKFPVYYPTVEQKEVPYATRREDVYNPTQYPVFLPEKTKSGPPPEAASRPEAAEPTSPPAPAPAITSTLQHTVPVPEVNRFSPPAETEGGFIPKGPGIIDEYYAVYPSTPPPVPHLTTSMQINPDTPDKVECITHDGRRVPEGESVWLACSVCACSWGELSCAPRRCVPPPPGCRRRPATASTADLCCGEIVCKYENTTTPAPLLSTRRTEIKLNVTKVPTEIPSDVIPFDPPPDRSEPEPQANNPTNPNQNIDLQGNMNMTDQANVTTPQLVNVHIAPNTSTSMPIGETKKDPTTSVPLLLPSSSTETSSTTSTQTPPTPGPEQKQTNYTDSQEYEDDDEDEGFSFGSVLKLLLSDNFDATTATPKKKPPTPAMTTSFPTTTTSQPAPTTTRRLVSRPTVPPFIPVQSHAYIPPKKSPQQSSVNRIDHLILGESTAIRKTTARPVTTPFRPLSTPIRRFTTRTTTRKPIVTTRITTRVTKTEEPLEHTPGPIVETARPSVIGGGVSPGGGGGGAGGLLKLAGCNIYGQMYRVGRIIAELSTPCQECRCTEFGVQCLPLRC